MSQWVYLYLRLVALNAIFVIYKCEKVFSSLHKFDYNLIVLLQLAKCFGLLSKILSSNLILKLCFVTDCEVGMLLTYGLDADETECCMFLEQ